MDQREKRRIIEAFENAKKALSDYGATLELDPEKFEYQIDEFLMTTFPDTTPQRIRWGWLQRLWDSEILRKTKEELIRRNIYAPGLISSPTSLKLPRATDGKTSSFLFVDSSDDFVVKDAFFKTLVRGYIPPWRNISFHQYYVTLEDYLLMKTTDGVFEGAMETKEETLIRKLFGYPYFEAVSFSLLGGWASETPPDSAMKGLDPETAKLFRVIYPAEPPL